MPVALVPALSFAVHEDGTLEVTSPWFPHVAFSVETLARCDRQRFILRGDEIEFRCTNGGALYALAPSDADGVRAGHLIRAWG